MMMSYSSVFLVTMVIQLTVAMPTCKMQGDLVRSAHNLLRDLGARFPLHCLKYNTNISFPDSALLDASANSTQCRAALWLVYETLQGAGLMFEENELPVSVKWDERKLEHYLNLQDRVLGEGSCLSGVDVLSSYFSNVTAVVEQQESSACGWLALRRDVLWVLRSSLQTHHHCFLWRNHTHRG